MPAMAQPRAGTAAGEKRVLLSEVSPQSQQVYSTQARPRTREQSACGADLQLELAGDGSTSKPQQGLSPPQSPLGAAQAFSARTPASPNVPKNRRLKFKSNLTQLHTPGAALKDALVRSSKGVDTLFQRAQDQFELNRAQACQTLQSPTHCSPNKLGLRNQVFAKHRKHRTTLAQPTPASALSSPATGFRFREGKYRSRPPSATNPLNADL